MLMIISADPITHFNNDGKQNPFSIVFIRRGNNTAYRVNGVGFLPQLGPKIEAEVEFIWPNELAAV